MVGNMLRRRQSVTPRTCASTPDLGRLSPAKCQVRTAKALRTKDLGPFRAVRTLELGLHQENDRPPDRGEVGHGAAEVQKP